MGRSVAGWMTMRFDGQRTIGGVFALETQGRRTPAVSLLSAWTKGAAATYFFHNAQSALHHVLADTGSPRLWLPAYLCPEIGQAPQGLRLEVLYYPVGTTLEPNTSYLEERLKPGDAVLGIDYFGRPAPAEWRSLAASSRDVTWIEDCAQSIDSGAHYAGIRIYSPRKVLGAPDGGVLVDIEGSLSPPHLGAQADEAFMRPYLMRADDPHGKRNREWYRAFRVAEDAMSVSRRAMSKTSHVVLLSAGIAEIAERRRTNYAFLRDTLDDMALFPKEKLAWVPLGFPIVSNRAKDLCAFLAKHRIYAPRHWQGLSSPPGEFAGEHALSGVQVTIPCDQRCDVVDMQRVVSLVRAFNE